MPLVLWICTRTTTFTLGHLPKTPRPKSIQKRSFRNWSQRESNSTHLAPTLQTRPPRSPNITFDEQKAYQFKLSSEANTVANDELQYRGSSSNYSNQNSTELTFHFHFIEMYFVLIGLVYILIVLWFCVNVCKQILYIYCVFLSLGQYWGILNNRT